MDQYVEYQKMVGLNIGLQTDIDYLVSTYEDYSLTEGFFQMRNAYPCYRPVLGDGNCFYRAVAFSYLRQVDLNQFERVFQVVDNYCISRDFHINSSQLMNHLYRIYNNKLAPISHTLGPKRQSLLTQLFNNTPNFDDLMIMYLRSVNYREIHSNYDKYRPYINTDKPDQIENIKLLNQEAEGLEFDAMANALNIIIVTNSVTSKGFKEYQYRGRSPVIRIDLFFRPGHYDISYAKDSIYLKGFQGKSKDIPTPMYPTSKKPQDSYRSSLFQSSQSKQTSKPQRNHYRQPQSRQDQRRLSSFYNNPQYQKIPNPNFDNNNRKSNEAQRQKFLLQKGAKPFDKKKDQKASMYDQYKIEQNNPRCGLNSLRQDKASIKKQQNLTKPKKQSYTAKSATSQQESQIKTVPATRVWKTSQVQDKSVVQEIAILLLFLLSAGFLFFKILN